MLGVKYNHFNFREICEGVYFVSNDFGGWKILNEEAFLLLVNGNINTNSQLYKDLYEAYFILDNNNINEAQRTLIKMKDFMFNTKDYALLILKITNFCNYNCLYCQASSDVSNKEDVMTFETAVNAINMILDHGVKYLTIEFQGGEPLYNFSLIKQIVHYVERNVKPHKDIRELSMRLMSNLSLLTDDMVQFLLLHNVGIGTSLDGPCSVNDEARQLKDGNGTFDLTFDKYKIMNEKYNMPLGFITTVPRSSLKHAKEIADFRIKFQDPFYLRPLFRVGKAAEIWDSIGYEAEQFIDFYKEVVDRLVQYDLDTKNNYTMESRTVECLNRLILKEENDVEINSPCGSIVSMVSVDWNGDVITCEGAKMLTDKQIRDKFIIGNVNTDESFEIFYNRKTLNTLKNNNSATDPDCYRCAYAPFCGNCNIEREVSNVEHLFDCKINCGIFDYILEKALFDAEYLDVLNTWLFWQHIEPRGKNRYIVRKELNERGKQFISSSRDMFRVLEAD